MDIRFVPGQDPEAVVAAIRAHLDGRGFAHVKMTASGLYPGSRSRPADAVVAALVAACEAHGRDVTMLPIHAGAAPLYLFSEVLGVPYAFGGLGHGGRSHAPDEYLDVASMGDYMKSMVSLLYRFAEKLR
jgi:acetylornithine deacetylase/succinyl-diaminopimelate desuccinylase-like protein